MGSSQDYGPSLVVNYAMAPTPNIERCKNGTLTFVVFLDLQQNICLIIPQGYAMIKKQKF